MFSVIKKRALGIAVTAFGFAFVAFWAFSCLIAFLVPPPVRVFGKDTPASYGMPYRDLRFKSSGSGGVTIAAWFLPVLGAKNALVLVHGKDSSRTVELGGRFLRLARELRARGFSILMIDLRGHGLSGDGRITFGTQERKDIAAAVQWLKSEGYSNRQVGLLGVSMGGAAAIGAAADNSSIGAVVSDSSYSEIRSLIEAKWPETRLPAVFLPSSLLMTRLIWGYDLAEASPVSDLKSVTQPVFLIHCEADRLIPVQNVDALKQVAPGAQLWKVPGCGHAGAYLAQPEGYAQKVSAFFKKALVVGKSHID